MSEVNENVSSTTQEVEKDCLILAHPDFEHGDTCYKAYCDGNREEYVRTVAFVKVSTLRKHLKDESVSMVPGSLIDDLCDVCMEFDSHEQHYYDFNPDPSDEWCKPAVCVCEGE